MPPEPRHQGPENELEDLLEDVLNREGGDAHMRRLNELLRDDPAARHTYLETMHLDAAVSEEFPPEVTSGDEESPRRPEGRGRRVWIVLATAASVALLGLMAASALRGDRGKPVSNPPPGQTVEAVPPAVDEEPVSPVLFVNSIEQGVASFGGAAVTVGDQLPKGRLHVASGTVELTFHSGVKVRLVAPADLAIEGEYRVQLVGGKAVLDVPAEAREFVLYTPSAFINRFGGEAGEAVRTELAAEVLASAATDLHVFRGKVEAAPSSGSGTGPGMAVASGAAVRLINGHVDPIPYRERPFEFPPESTGAVVPEFVHWSLDNWDGPETIDQQGDYRLNMVRSGKAVSPEQISGPFGQGVRFDGRGHYAISDYPGVGGSAPRSVAFWVRISPYASFEIPNGILSWGEPKQTKKWQVAWNAGADQGIVGAPRIEFGNGYVIGHTDLRDGRWHHLAVVFLGGPNADVSSHVRIYVDGVLETLSGRRQNRIDTASGAEAEPLVLGRYLGLWPGRDPFYFEGDIDEVFVVQGALQPAQVVRIMNGNTLD